MGCNNILSVMVVCLDELKSVYTVYIEHIHNYALSRPNRSSVLACIGHALSVP